MTRLLAFTDPHGDRRAADKLVALSRRHDPRLIVCSGDIAWFGDKYAGFLDRLSALKRTVCFVPGNREPADVCRRIESRYPFMKDVSYRHVELEGVQVVGVPGTLDIAPPSCEDDRVFDLAMGLWGRLDRSRPVLLLTHYPPTGTRCDGLRRRPGDPIPIALPAGDEGGSRVVQRIVEALQPDLVVTGHYHQSFGEEDRIGRSHVLNPGPEGRVIELTKNI